MMENLFFMLGSDDAEGARGMMPQDYHKANELQKQPSLVVPGDILAWAFHINMEEEWKGTRRKLKTTYWSLRLWGLCTSAESSRSFRGTGWQRRTSYETLSKGWRQVNIDES